ncbi:MAG TPA: efflux RND transporter periplasmic adaptor subunit [Gemmataceae bacterium]|nr:efflux RND transporter periplasmic adaptor subunit [Gemmataceae bacterium]
MKRHPFDWPARLFVVAGLFSLFGCHKAAPPEEEEVKAPVKVVAAQKVSLGQYTELLGATQTLPQHAARVTAPVEGHVLWALSDGTGKAIVEGQHVEKGQVIVQLDDRIIRANRTKTQAMLEDLKAQKQQADIALQLAQLERDRLEKLLPGGNGSIPLVSRVELEKASLTTKDAEAKQKAVIAKENALRGDLEVLDVQLDYHKLRTPIAGRLGTVQAVPGQTLPIGTSVAEVVDLREIDVVCVVPPDSAARLVLGQSAWLMTNQQPAAPRESSPVGKVVFIAVQAQADTGNFLAKVRFPNPDLRLRANMVVRVQVLTQPEQERLTIPEAALMEDLNQPFVVVVEDVKTEKNKEGEEQKLGTARRLQAITGIRDRERHLVEILGLEDPEKKEKVSLDDLLFVTEGGRGLHNEDAVRIEEAAKEEEKEKEKD